MIVILFVCRVDGVLGVFFLINFKNKRGNSYGIVY